MNYPKTIINLIECYKKFPGIGEKSAERMAIHTLSFNDELIELFSQTLLDSKQKIKYCSICGNYTENNICDICNDDSRNKKIICVVEEAKNINMIEKTNSFNGVYHILNGLISPIDGINPEDINLKSLITRVQNDNIEEVIIVVKPSIEGETTALYISKLLEETNVVVSKIARGVPIGSEIDYIDSLTLERALLDRKKVEN